MTVLVVDDELITRECLCNYFSEERYRVLAAATAEEAEQILAREAVDLILLDIRMPGKDGLTLTRELRVHSEVGIILISARQDAVDQLIGLECGADDYVTKPFNPREILARAKNLCRRVRLTRAQAPSQVEAELLRFDECTVDLGLRQVSGRDNQVSPLTAGEFQLLSVLLSNIGKTMSRDQLLDQMRNREWAPNDRTVDVLVGRLRRKLRDDPANPRIILTIHGVGYLLAAKALQSR
ncbi:response regulator [Pseudomonas benzenivorans]|uniref:Response regulator n=1 Tax=Pseudomonas benzenivorans TaxID=556533 RepID=A0ABY5HCD5_9PSED|nr:response regulator [Pseudomonas benzenivorans]UTW09863.1 response regulator [Pseudomonas benzenivorans]